MVFLNLLRGKDLNQRPPGYEPDELPTALLRDIELVVPVTGLEPVQYCYRVYHNNRKLSNIPPV